MNNCQKETLSPVHTFIDKLLISLTGKKLSLLKLNPICTTKNTWKQSATAWGISFRNL